MERMKRDCEKRRARAIDYILSTDPEKDWYSYAAVLRMLRGVDTALAEAQIKWTAEWFEHPHPEGRDPRGESDFAAKNLLHVLYLLYGKLSVDTRASLDRLFLTKNFTSKFGSENHALMGRVVRLLAAQFYKERYFEQFGMTAALVYAEAKAYIEEFLDYRAHRGWGEFDSCGYNAEDMAILNTLYSYAEDARLKELARKHMDILLLDMIVDSKCGVHGGAHGRIYPNVALDGTYSDNKKKFFHSSTYGYYCYYFGAEGGFPEKVMAHTATLLSDYYPSEIVCRVAKNRTYPYENRERRHLHVSRGFRDSINRDLLTAVEGLSIDKYTYVCDDYMLGGVNHQDDYPADHPCGWYAHHEQHEWELTLLSRGEGRAKIFSHHPGNPGYYQIHNQWTGTNGRFSASENTTSLTSLSFGLGPSGPLFSTMVFHLS